MQVPSVPESVPLRNAREDALRAGRSNNLGDGGDQGFSEHSPKCSYRTRLCCLLAGEAAGNDAITVEGAAAASRP